MSSCTYELPTVGNLEYTLKVERIKGSTIDRRRRTRLGDRDRRAMARRPESPEEELRARRLIDAGHSFVEPAGNREIRYRVLKRLLDILGASLLIVALAPLLLTVLAVLLVTTRGKPFYSQERVGYCGRRFRMWKFRSMRLDADKLQHLVKNEADGPIFKNRCDPRITRIGRIIRATSIDELPQLFNVLLGHMSLVGPRPMLAKEVAQQKTWQRRRFAVMPGLTCLWQISGRSEVSFENWMRMDLWYLSHQNLWTDLKLLVKTPLKVVTGKGAY